MQKFASLRGVNWSGGVNKTGGVDWTGRVAQTGVVYQTGVVDWINQISKQFLIAYALKYVEGLLKLMEYKMVNFT